MHLDELFPVPSLPPSLLSPQRLPGANPDSLAALRDVLKDNHERHHIFFNDLHFHNHTMHRALAIYALGGSAAIIRDYYERDSRIQRPAFESPEPITQENFVDHLGDEKFYQAYVAFFSRLVSEEGAERVLEEFVFSERYNFREGGDATAQPAMLARLLAAFLHPMIHVGYGVEFGLKGMIAEGLALAAVDQGYTEGALHCSAFALSSTSIAVEHSANRLYFLLGTQATSGSSVVHEKGTVHAFDITARILKDSRLSLKAPTDFLNQSKQMFVQCFPAVWEHAKQWSVNVECPGEIERKLEELIWLCALIYGVGGSTASGFQADTVLMHLVTSSLFLPSLIAYISPRSRVLLLRGYLATVLTWWVTRGPPGLDIESFMVTTSVTPSISTPPPSKTTETTPIPNPFLPILQSAITHPSDHLIKIQRAFAHFDVLYGRRPAGHFQDTELKGAASLDGSLFLRASLLTADCVGWVREGQEPRDFGLEGFYA